MKRSAKKAIFIVSGEDVKARIESKFRENIRKTVALFAGGNASLRCGKFFDEADMQALRERVDKSTAIESL